MNRKRVKRLWRKHGHTVPARQQCKRVRSSARVPAAAAHPSRIWTCDFIFDGGGRRLKILSVPDEFTHARGPDSGLWTLAGCGAREGHLGRDHRGPWPRGAGTRRQPRVPRQDGTRVAHRQDLSAHHWSPVHHARNRNGRRGFRRAFTHQAPITDSADRVQATKVALRNLARRIVVTESEIPELVRRAALCTISLWSVGVDHADELLVTAGGRPERLHSEAAFAQLGGVAPIPAFSGCTERHRLHRSGNRAANRAPHLAIFVRPRCCRATRS